MGHRGQSSHRRKASKGRWGLNSKTISGSSDGCRQEHACGRQQQLSVSLSYCCTNTHTHRPQHNTNAVRETVISHLEQSCNPARTRGTVVAVVQPRTPGSAWCRLQLSERRRSQAAAVAWWGLTLTKRTTPSRYRSLTPAQGSAPGTTLLIIFATPLSPVSGRTMMCDAPFCGTCRQPEQSGPLLKHPHMSTIKSIHVASKKNWDHAHCALTNTNSPADKLSSLDND